jgi:membrane-associated phospholipid phosphatase
LSVASSSFLRLLSILGSAAICLVLISVSSPGQDAPAVDHPAVPPSLATVPSPLGSLSHRLATSESSSRSTGSRDVSFTLLPYNFLHDQQTILSLPFQLAKGHQWAPTITVSAATIALLSADAHVDPYFVRTPAFGAFNRIFGSNITGAETLLAPTALYLIGSYTGDSYMEKTALFAGEAVADSELVRVFLNSTTTRWRPQDIYRQRTYWNTFFHSKSYVGSSFPSGHMIAAVSIATVIARRYRSRRWVPWAAYGIAGAIGFSRITLRAHFPSDVFLGTVLGYAIARYDVLEDQ